MKQRPDIAGFFGRIIAVALSFALLSAFSAGTKPGEIRDSSVHEKVSQVDSHYANVSHNVKRSTIQDTANVLSTNFVQSRQAVQNESCIDKSCLTQLLDSTDIKNLKPRASGYRSDDSGTAPYDKVNPNTDDVSKLEISRNMARNLINIADTSQSQINQASQNLEQTFKNVRFIYHYTGFPGTAGSPMYDNNGNLIQAHGSGIQKVERRLLVSDDQKIDKNNDGYVYVWCGEDKTDGLVARGVHIYYSDDCYNWIDKGLGFQTYFGDEDLQNKMSGSDKTYQRYYNVKNIERDPDYTRIYGKDFSVFKNDKSNNNIGSPERALDLLLWDLKALKGTGADTTQASAVFERPKMAYNSKMKRWVIWFHADGPQYNDENSATYSKSKAGVAISADSNPAGPYKYLGSFRMSPGRSNLNPGMSRDMNLYVDKGKDANHDGVDDAYLIYSSNENKDLTISLLDSTYTKLVKPPAAQRLGSDVSAGDTYNIVATNSKESPAPFKWKGHYYIVYSETTGWAPNENKYTVSENDNILGPYREVGTPFIQGDGPNQSPSNSFFSQSSSVVPYDEKHGLFVYVGDRWFDPGAGGDISQSRYVVVPIRMVCGTARIYPAADWKLVDFKKYCSIGVRTWLRLFVKQFTN